MKKHLIVVSVDALVYEDLEDAVHFPNFGRILREGCRINRVRTIYPSLTHPVHASMMSGCPAGRTGVPANEIFTPGALKRPWYNDLSQMKCETIFHAAHKAGLSTCACSWPVTAHGGEYIDYLVPEVMDADLRGREGDVPGVFRDLGTSPCVMDIIENAYKLMGYSNDHPDCDQFEIAVAAEIIRRYKPDMLFTHPGYVDNRRHRTGVFSPDVTHAVAVTDEWLGVLLRACKDAGIAENTDFVVASDHGQLNITRRVCPNVFLRDAGLIKVDDEGNVTEWDAWCSSTGLSAHVYLRDPQDETLKSSVYRLLKERAEEGLSGFSEVLTKDEVRERYGLDGDFTFVLETDGFTSLSDDWNRPVVRSLSGGNVRAGSMTYRFGHATHGHMPEKGPQPPFLAMGPSFRKGVVIEEGSILDHAPTFAKILGVELPEAEGKCVDELLNIE